MIKAKRSGHATFETPDLDKTIAYFTGVSGLVRNEGEGSRLPASKIGPSRWSSAARASWQCSISPLTANCAAVTSLHCASMTWRNGYAID